MPPRDVREISRITYNTPGDGFVGPKGYSFIINQSFIGREDAGLACCMSYPGTGSLRVGVTAMGLWEPGLFLSYHLFDSWSSDDYVVLFKVSVNVQCRPERYYRLWDREKPFTRGDHLAMGGDDI